MIKTCLGRVLKVDGRVSQTTERAQRRWWAGGGMALSWRQSLRTSVGLRLLPDDVVGVLRQVWESHNVVTSKLVDRFTRNAT